MAEINANEYLLRTITHRDSIGDAAIETLLKVQSFEIVGSEHIPQSGPTL